MKLLFAVTLLAVSLLSSNRPVDAEDIIFSPLPTEQQTKVSRNIPPMLSSLGQQLNRSISIAYFSNYTDIQDQFDKSFIDLTLLEPLPSFILLANGKTLSTHNIETIRKALLQLTPFSNPTHFKLTSTLGGKIRYGAVTMKSTDYDRVKEELKKITTTVKGNF